MSDEMRPETSLVDAVLLALQVSRVIEKAEAEGTDIYEALKVRLPMLEKQATAGRVVLGHLADATHPEEAAKRATANKATAAAEKERRAAWGQKLAERQDLRLAREALAKCRDGLARAERELSTLQRVGASDHEQVMAEGAVAMWVDRIGKAEQNLAAIEKAAAGKVTP